MYNVHDFNRYYGKFLFVYILVKIKFTLIILCSYPFNFITLFVYQLTLGYFIFVLKNAIKTKL